MIETTQTTDTTTDIIKQPLKIHALDPRRKSVLILGNLLAAVTLTTIAAVLTMMGKASTTQVATLNIAAVLAIIITTYIIARLGVRITELEFWIRRMGDGDLEHSIQPRGHDELTEITYDLEVLRERSLRSQELDLVRELSEELQDKNAILENTLVELRNTQDQMISRQKLAEIGELAAGIAHEVRNPLNIISNFSATSSSLMEELVETIQEEDSNPEEREKAVQEIINDLTENMKRISDNCDRASRIIQDVTNMSRSEPSQQRPIEINKTLHDYALLAYQAARSQDQYFNINIVEEMNPDVGEITCIPEEIGRVFINIASNACYATNQKRINPETPADYKPTMTLITRREGKGVTATIRDNGNGIPTDTIQRIFNPFFTTKPTNEGTGLGLSLSHEIIRHHGGTITVDSEPGQYTEMKIQLPDQSSETAETDDEQPVSELRNTSVSP